MLGSDTAENVMVYVGVFLNALSPKINKVTWANRWFYISVW